MTGADSLLETVAAGGVDLCFANPGTTEMPLVAALDRVPRVRAVLGLFEGVCTGAADGFARMTGRPALTLLHLGPGFANGIANLHNARRANSPVLNLIGDQASWHLAADAPLTSDIDSLAQPVSGWVRTSGSAKTVARDAADGLTASLTPPGQVSTLILPADHQWEAAAGPVDVKPAPGRDMPGGDTIDRVAGEIRAADKVALLVGGAGLSERGQVAAARIASQIQGLALVETFSARCERGHHIPSLPKLPYFPEQAVELLAGFDRVVLAGARDPVAFFGYPDGASRIVPEEKILPLAGVADDVEGALEALADALMASPLDHTPPALPDASPSGPLDPATVGVLLARWLPEHAIVVDEAATSGLPFAIHSAGAAPHTLLSLTGGAIGQGLPCATGAALACPDRKVIAFQADGSGQYTLQALWTQRRESLDVLTLVCANRSYRILQVELARAGIAEPGPQARALTSLSEPTLDWVSLATGYGVPAERVTTTDALQAALTRRNSETGPRLIEMVL